MSGKLAAVLFLIFFTFPGTKLFSQVADTTSFTIVPRLSFYSYEKVLITGTCTTGVIYDVLNIKLIYLNSVISEWKGESKIK